MEHVLWVLMVVFFNGSTVDTQAVKPMVTGPKCFEMLNDGAKSAGVKLKTDASGFWMDKNTWVSCVPVKHGMIW